MKRICVVIVLLLLLLPGCGTEPIPALDAESVRLAESSDAVCLAYIMGYDDQEDGSVLLQCTAAQDCLGSLTDRGTALGPDELQTFLLRVEDGSRFQEEWMARIQNGKPARLLLFLKVTGERREQYDWDRGLGEYAVFVPNGEAGLRWEPGDREGLRYLQSLREYGKSHPREPLGDGICWTSHYID
ncbi:MAG: hypothetical protein IKX47_00990 [Oscillospiraceae bacterium]|nr:hypothetical protein [Oscillospiraceae bacterium]